MLKFLRLLAAYDRVNMLDVTKTIKHVHYFADFLIFPLSPMWFHRSPFPCTVNFGTFCDDTYLTHSYFYLFSNFFFGIPNV